jgi:hypothetical protein
VPDRRAGKACDLGDAEGGGSAGCVHHLLGSAAAHALRFAITPDMRRENRFMARIDGVADRLPNKMIANGVTFEMVAV